ncbi:MAG TPA: amidohydrolase family protein [Ilumatobacteraceae bacterium]|nr:amidohydrolase family protein [Ilumatobacteraceae bacterium]
MAPITDDENTEPRFTDAHVHFWDHGQPELRWLFLEPGFEHPRLKGTQRLDAPRYTPAELRSEAGTNAPTKVVHIQCAAPTADPFVESAWLDGLAAEQGWPNAIVAGCRIREEGAASAIEANAASPRFRGVRDLSVQGAVEPAEVALAFDAASDHAASVELMVPVEHYDSIASLAARWPAVTIVLGHAGQPLERSSEYLARWSSALARLADAAANVVVKVSAIASSADPGWSTETIRPWVLAAIEAFGPNRSMLATNWPIDRLYGSYHGLVDAYRTIVAELPPADRDDVLHGTADRVYRI